MNWVDYRLEEINEKVDLRELPTHDMDGCHFTPEWEDSEELKWADASESISRRLLKFNYTRCPF